MAKIFEAPDSNFDGARSFKIAACPKLAQKYVAQSNVSLGSVLLGMKKFGSANDVIGMDVYHGGTNPENGTLVLSSGVDVGNVDELNVIIDNEGIPYEMYWFPIQNNPDYHYDLVSGEIYWFVFKSSGANDNVNHPMAIECTTALSYVQEWFFDGATWTQYSGHSLRVVLYDNSVVTQTLYNTSDNNPTGTLATTGSVIDLNQTVSAGYAVGTSNIGDLSDEASWKFVVYFEPIATTYYLGAALTSQLFTGVDMPSYADLMSFALGDADNLGIVSAKLATDSGGTWTIGSNTYTVILVQSNTYSGYYYQISQLSGAATGDVQLLNVGKNDNLNPIYYELETQELEFSNRAVVKSVLDKLGIVAQYADDSKIQIISDDKNPVDIKIPMGKRINAFTLPVLKGYYITLRWSGSTTTKSPILEGFYFNKILNKGING